MHKNICCVCKLERGMCAKKQNGVRNLCVYILKTSEPDFRHKTKRGKLLVSFSVSYHLPSISLFCRKAVCLRVYFNRKKIKRNYISKPCILLRRRCLFVFLLEISNGKNSERVERMFGNKRTNENINKKDREKTLIFIRVIIYVNRSKQAVCTVLHMVFFSLAVCVCSVLCCDLPKRFETVLQPHFLFSVRGVCFPFSRSIDDGSVFTLTYFEKLPTKISQTHRQTHTSNQHM